ncbi:MAG: LytR C-terminal domain-containing protein [Pseudonocardiaceae bacterium]
MRVYNNSTIHGLAARAARDFTAAGWTVVEVGNYAAGVIPTSTVYYQDGTDQLATAQALGAEFSMRVESRFPGIMSAKPGLIAIVTNDYGT